MIHNYLPQGFGNIGEFVTKLNTAGLNWHFKPMTFFTEFSLINNEGAPLKWQLSSRIKIVRAGSLIVLQRIRRCKRAKEDRVKNNLRFNFMVMYTVFIPQSILSIPFCPLWTNYEDVFLHSLYNLYFLSLYIQLV